MYKDLLLLFRQQARLDRHWCRDNISQKLIHGDDIQEIIYQRHWYSEYSSQGGKSDKLERLARQIGNQRDQLGSLLQINAIVATLTRTKKCNKQMQWYELWMCELFISKTIPLKGPMDWWRVTEGQMGAIFPAEALHTLRIRSVFTFP